VAEVHVVVTHTQLAVLKYYAKYQYCRIFINRPHRSTTQMRPIVTDGVECGLSVSVCQSVGRSVCHDPDPCKNGWTDRDAVWDTHSGEPKEASILDSGAH